MLELFANPAYLAAGTALVSAPIIIHLINRMRFKRLRWAAMEFLLKSQKRNRRRLIIEQLILLMLRCLLIALATLLVSRFFGFSFAADQSKDIVHIVLLDDTLSMNDEFKEGENVRTCFQVAKNSELLDKVVKGLSMSNRNDRLMVLPLSKIVTDRTYQAKTYTRLGDKAKRDELKNDLDLLEVSKLHTSMLPGLKKVQEIVTGNPESRIMLYVLSDFRQSDWAMPGAEPLRKEFLKLASTPEIEIRLRDVAHPFRIDGQGGVPLSHDNIGIVDLRAGTRIAGKDMPVSFTITVANYSAREADVNVAIFDDSNGQEMLQVDFNPSMPLKIPAGSTASATFEVRFNPAIKGNESYFAQISARLENPQRGKLDNDGLADDNIRHASVEVRDKVPVLVIDGEGARGRDENRDSFFIRNAIVSVPGASYDVVYGDEIAGGVAAKVLERADLSRYPTIFILNVREFTAKQLANLENYVRDGGGVAFFLGPLVSAEYYNKNLYQKGKGLFPMPLRETFFPPAADEPRKPEYTGLEHVLLRDSSYPNPENFPIFGQVFRETKTREFLKDLPIKRYFQVPRSDWKLEKGRVEELATLPNDLPITQYTASTLDIFRRLDAILKNEEYQGYQPGLDRHRKVIENLVGPTSDKKAQHLAGALEAMLNDKGKEKDRKDYPNLTELWTTSDPKVRTLREEIASLIDQVRYGDPFVVLGNYGKGKVVAITTTAGKEWNDWGGGSEAALIYQPFIWEMQNFLSSQAADSYLTVGTPVQIVVDAEQYKQKNRLLKMERYFMKAVPGKPAVQTLDSEQFGEQDKGELRFTFDKNLEPGLYVSKLVPEGGKTPLASWSHVFNVDTPREGKLQRVSGDEMESNLVREGSGRIRFESAQSSGDDLVARQRDLSESPWFFLLFLGILVAEQALAVHLSFHLRSGEGEMSPGLPARTVRAA